MTITPPWGTFVDPLNDIVVKVRDHAESLGVFSRINGHEPKHAPVTGRSPDITCSVWIDGIRPARSGLSATSATLDLNVRLYTLMTREPQDAIDPTMVGACHRLMADYVNSFTLGSLARGVDVRAIEGKAMTMQAGYVEMDGKLFRTMTIVLPVTVNDLWPENP